MRTLLQLCLLSIAVSSCTPFGVFSLVGNDLTSKLNQANEEKQGLPNDEGECYAKCVIPDQLTKHNKELFVFTGDVDNTTVALKEEEIIVSPASSSWVKKKSNQNCKSADPEDCLVWCLVEVPAQKESYITVVDTSTTDQYEIINREIKQLEFAGGQTEWRQVLCEKELTSELVMDVQNFLFGEGLYLEPINGMITDQTQTALEDYQREQSLPIGHFDFETLEAMGIEY